MPKDLAERMLKQSGVMYVWQGRLDWRRHRTRQAVQKDLQRTAKALHVRGCVAPHSARKAWAVRMYARYGLKRVQALLGHRHEAVTLLYVMADHITARKRGGQDQFRAE